MPKLGAGVLKTRKQTRRQPYGQAHPHIGVNRFDTYRRKKFHSIVLDIRCLSGVFKHRGKYYIELWKCVKRISPNGRTRG